MEDLRVEVPDGLNDLSARPGVGLGHEHVKGPKVGGVFVLVGWETVDGSHGCRGTPESLLGG